MNMLNHMDNCYVTDNLLTFNFRTRICTYNWRETSITFMLLISRLEGQRFS